MELGLRAIAAMSKHTHMHTHTLTHSLLHLMSDKKKENDVVWPPRGKKRHSQRRLNAASRMRAKGMISAMAVRYSLPVSSSLPCLVTY